MTILEYNIDPTIESKAQNLICARETFPVHALMGTWSVLHK